MDGVLGAIENAAVIEALRYSRWAYAAVNTVHILGLALVVGATIPLNLRLLGLAWRQIARTEVVRVLAATAASGLMIAVGAGATLFATRAGEYADSQVFLLKIALIAIGAGAAIMAHIRHGWLLERASRGSCKVHACISLVCWLGALACGRLIAFTLP